ncbi:hypothetical protein F5Y14DRAFT_440893 [Nemania sp. NC0429]|nr:hypothetical protein F5Y14DRAFT_440893 [Nemania sp. NC0429]
MGSTYDIVVRQLDSGDGDGGSIIFDLNKQQISVPILPRSASEPGEQWDQIQHTDLHSFLYPTTLTFRLGTVDGRPTIAPIYLDIDDDVLQCWALVGRVLVDGHDMLCKANTMGLLHLDLEREVENMQKIREARRSHAMLMHVPQLLGYVTHAENGRIIGLLRQWIPGRQLAKVGIPATSVARRQNWASQIQGMVDELHEMGVIWGDVKASNVVIDEADDAWLIDSGGGFTNGWVDRELAGTLEGDKQGLRKMIEFLKVEEGDLETVVL